MVNTEVQHVFFLDDNPEVRNAVRRILRGIGIKVSCFADPATCMAKLRSQKCNLLITDLRMPGADGFEVLEEVKHLAPWVPVLVISGYGDIPAAVRAVKAGAVDFIEKPLEKRGFIHKIKLILAKIDPADASLGKPLTQTEIGVLRLVIDGKSSKEIARMFYRSTRTIEGHRSHIMHKLKAGNLLDLLKRDTAMGLVDVGAKPELARMSEMLRTGHETSET